VPSALPGLGVPSILSSFSSLASRVHVKIPWSIRFHVPHSFSRCREQDALKLLSIPAFGCSPDWNSYSPSRAPVSTMQDLVLNLHFGLLCSCARFGSRSLRFPISFPRADFSCLNNGRPDFIFMWEGASFCCPCSMKCT
jgi:hypothetical protein